MNEERPTPGVSKNGGIRQPHHFQPGNNMNPKGRPKGSLTGRGKALGTLDTMLGKAQNQKRLAVALQASLTKDPLWFFMNIIMPLLPKDIKMDLGEGGGVFLWRSLANTFPIQGSDSSTTPTPGSAPSAAAGAGAKPRALPPTS